MHWLGRKIKRYKHSKGRKKENCTCYQFSCLLNFPLFWRKWPPLRKILREDLNPNPSNQQVATDQMPHQRPEIACSWRKIQEDVDIPMAKRKKKEAATMAKAAYINKECVSGTNVSFLPKESQLECHRKWQNRSNITALIHSSFTSAKTQSQICRGKISKNGQHCNK